MTKAPYRIQAERPRVPREHRRWYTKSGDVEKGPFEAAVVRRSLKEGFIRGTTLVRGEDETEWRPVSTVKDITLGVAPSSSGATRPSPGASTVLREDDGTKTLIYGALACALGYVGIIFGVMGIRLAREQLRRGPGKYTRAGYVLSIVGLGIQLFALVVAIVVIVLSNKGVLH